MVTDPHIPIPIIQDIIRAAERRHGVSLSNPDFKFLTTSMSTFVESSIEKFVAGAAEHNREGDSDFVSTVNHNSELSKELIDAWFYHTAQQCRSKL